MDLWLIAEQRSEELTNAETIRLGRGLVRSSGRGHVWYPPDEPTSTVVITDYTGELSAKAVALLSEVLGIYRQELRG
ncbi:MAG: hypothetical protein M0Z30_20420 [Actinomycetota bacterium]|nr:hypothetical protein [Actinomycetota bacterium]